MSGLTTLDYQLDLDGLLVGQGTEFGLKYLKGWRGQPPMRTSDVPRANAHGVFEGEDLADARLVEFAVDVLTASPANLLALQRRTIPGRRMTLWVRTPGEPPLSAQVRARRAPVDVDVAFELGLTEVVVQLAAPDPRRYALAAGPGPVGLPTSGAGLVYPLVYPLDYGALGATGQTQLTNNGTADAPVVLVVTGPLPMGFEISSGARRLRYPVEVPAGSSIRLSSADGSVLLDGASDRRRDLTVAQWFGVPALSTVALQFVSLGGAYDPAAQLTATVTPAYW